MVGFVRFVYGASFGGKATSYNRAVLYIENGHMIDGVIIHLYTFEYFNIKDQVGEKIPNRRYNFSLFRKNTLLPTKVNKKLLTGNIYVSPVKGQGF